MLHIELVEKCKANDRQAQMQLYRQYCDGMFLVAYRYVKNEKDAEDVLQDAFVKAFQRLDQFTGDVSFGAWLKRIVINQSLDLIKSRRHDYIEFDDNLKLIEDDNNWEIDEHISVNRIKEEVLNLPEKYRYVVMMYLIEGYDHSEIAQVLGITETTCRTRLLRGKGHLKNMLKEKNYATGY